MSRTRRMVAGGAAAVGLTLGAAAVAGAVTGQTPPPVEGDADDTQEPELNSSVQLEDDDTTSEEDERSQLEALARVEPDAAAAAAVAAVPGTAGDAELENENGSVVYEVPVTADDGTVTEVKVDAGDGTVLATEIDDDDETEDDDETDDGR